MTSCTLCMVLVAFDRATLPWYAGQVLRAGQDHGGLVLFRRTVRSTAYGHQARLLTSFRADEGHAWDWLNRLVYLKSGVMMAANQLEQLGSQGATS